MSDLRATPGPWVAENSSVLGPDDNVVACCVSGAVIRGDAEEDYATAKLISAALEMYDLLDTFPGFNSTTAEKAAWAGRVIEVKRKARGK